MSMTDAVKSRWKGLCTVKHMALETDKATGLTKKTEEVLYEDLPCHLNHYYYLRHAAKGEKSGAYQRYAVFLSPEIEVPLGSKLSIRQNGQAADYSYSGVPAVFSTHQELPVARYEEYI